jgi:hypothetical protein
MRRFLPSGGEPSSSSWSDEHGQRGELAGERGAASGLQNGRGDISLEHGHAGRVHEVAAAEAVGGSSAGCDGGGAHHQQSVATGP